MSISPADENHAALRERRRRTARSRFSVPPRLAKRRALSLVISASSPSRTREVFSLIPVSRSASRNSESSILSVVLMCMKMSYSCIQIKWRLSRYEKYDCPSAILLSARRSGLRCA